ncbi:MAG TPA: TonB-dependent receptor [Novosphingobium sp.]|nr:TonB-dependent receptor [Novosphingobium sp.]
MRTFLLASAAAVALSSNTAWAQTTPEEAQAEAESGRDVIIVTAQKREEDIQNVPLSIVAVTGETLIRAGINDPVALQKLAPSLQINNTIFSSGVVIRIRGFGSAANTPVDSEVASYIDGAYIPRPGAILSSFLDVASVEVLSGPQGTLFGRNATLGAISINTNAPSLRDRTLSLDFEAANHESFSATGVVNLPVSETFAVRFAGKNSTSGGYYNNLLDGRTYGDRDGFVGRASAKWEILPALTWVVRGDYSKTTGDGVYPQLVYTKTAPAALLNGYTAFANRAAGVTPVVGNEPSYTFRQRISDPFLRDRQYGITSQLTYEVSPVADIRLINSYRNWQNEQQIGDTVGTSYDLLKVLRFTKSLAQSHELQFISDKDAFLDSHLGITAGLYYAREEYTLNTDFNFGTQFCNVILAFAPAPVRNGCNAAPLTPAGINKFFQVAKSYAVYGQADYALTPQLTLGLGARHTWDEKNAISEQIRNNPGAGALVGNEAPNELLFEDDNTSFRASLSYEPTKDILFFGTFSTGYKSGGFNTGSPALLTDAQRTFQSTTVKDYQLGVKSILLNGRARLNLTLFNTNLHNFQDRSFDGTQFVIRNSGDVRSRGVDFDGDFEPIDNFKFTFGGAYLDSIYTRNPNAPGLEGCTGGPGCPLFHDLSGTRLPFAPKFKGRIGAEVSSGPMGSGYELTFAAHENYTSSFLTANTGNEQSRVDGYATTDLRLTLDSPEKNWSVTLFGTNVFDKIYYTTTVAQVLGNIIGVTSTTTGQTVFRGNLGEPARYGVRLSFDF